MIAIISLNVVSMPDQRVYNKYPMVMYYADESDNIKNVLKDDEEFINMLKDSIITLDNYMSLQVLYTTYYTDSKSINDEERTSKGVVIVHDIIPIDTIYDLLVKTAIRDVFKKECTDGIKNAIKALMTDGISMPTIVNGIRMRSYNAGIDKEDIKIIISKIIKKL